MPVCFNFAGELVVHSVDGDLKLAGVSPQVLDFEGVVRSLTPPTADGVCGFGVLLEIQEAHKIKFSHKDKVRTRGIDLPTESPHGGRIKVGHKVECWLEEANVPADAFLFRNDDLAKLVTVTQAAPAIPESEALPALAANSASKAPACDFSILATREQLIEAFGRFTGMDASWFKNITDTPALLAARKVTGQGGRGHIAEPWFCPFEVMQWLADSKRRKGRKLSTEKAWERLEKNFPKVHSVHSVADPRAGD